MNLELKNYKTQLGASCYISSISNSISSYIDNFDEGVIISMTKGLCLRYELDEQNIQDTILDSDVSKLSLKFLDLYNIEHKSNKIYNEEEFKKIVIENINKGFPSIVVVSSKYLKYDSSYSYGDARDHCVVIIGINKDGFIISDSYVPTYPRKTYCGLIPFTDFFKAFKESGNKYLYIDYEAIAALDKSWDIDIITLSFKEGIKEYLDSNNSIGIGALKSFVSDLEKYPKIYSKNMINDNIKEISYKIQFYAIFPLITIIDRILIRLEQHGRINEHGFHEILQEQEKAWLKITYAILKARHRPTDEYFMNLKSKLQNLVADQERILNQLYEAVY